MCEVFLENGESYDVSVHCRGQIFVDRYDTVPNPQPLRGVFSRV